MRIDRFFHAPVPWNGGRRNPAPVRGVEAVRPVSREDVRRPSPESIHRIVSVQPDLPTDRRVRQALEAYSTYGAPEAGAASLFGVDVYV